jgi:ABC-type branched-subunit amino acid transport system substrate-binding protein
MRHAARISLLLLAAVACTGGEAPRPRPPGPTSSSTSIPSPVTASVVLDVVAATDPLTPAGQDDRSYLDGMRLAVDAINAKGGLNARPLELRVVDDGGDTTRARRAMRDAIAERPAALLYVGPGPTVAPIRDELIRAGMPLILLQGDLYSTRDLVRPVFQTSIPWEWQARVIARYLVVDRKADRIVFAGIGPDAAARARTARTAVEYWGGELAGSVTAPAMGDLGPLVDAVRSADAVMLDAAPVDSQRAVGAIKEGIVEPPRIAGSAALLVTKGGPSATLPDLEDPPPGTTACYPYTWAGWAEPIPRVGRFIRSFEQDFGHPPTAFEQEGHDAVRTLAVALGDTGGRGGQPLIEALERIDGRVFSSFPVDLGPDDHLFMPRDELGLFAVPGRGEKLDPWQEPAGVNWRGLMRAFTYDGERDNILDRDRPVFFPNWKKPQPGPKYWKSRYGIVTRPSDPLH